MISIYLKGIKRQDQRRETKGAMTRTNKKLNFNVLNSVMSRKSNDETRGRTQKEPVVRI